MDITLCIGRPTIDKAASGEPVDMGHGVTILAADGLHRNSPYDEIDRLSARLVECESALARWDDGQDSEYWLRHPVCRAAEIETSK